MNAINEKKEKRLFTVAITIGNLLYLSKFLRPYFYDNSSALSVLGVLPNFGLAFVIPFIYASNRIRMNKPIKYFTVACVITLLLMILNEISDKYRPDRVFDWYDIYASIAGVTFSFLLFRIGKSNGIISLTRSPQTNE